MIERIELTKRFDKINPLSIEDYCMNDGYKMFKKAITMKQNDILDEITLSRITGRGGNLFTKKAEKNILFVMQMKGNQGILKIAI